MQTVSPKRQRAPKADQTTACWCGRRDLEPFNSAYVRCRDCQTLVCTCPPAPGDPAGDHDALYGREYWFSHQRESYGLGDIAQRSRTDLPERNIFWLNQLLKLTLPPGRALEIGCAHGGFVHLMREAGFDAIGLELSPAICDFAAKTFQIPMLAGRLEDQKLEPKSFDVIALMDVLEHLPDPLATIRRCVDLLTGDGVLLLQTPCFPAPKSLDELTAAADKFLIHLNPHEHTYLFSRDGARKLMSAAGCENIEFFPAIFGFYDMFLAASKRPLRAISDAQRWDHFKQTPRLRQVQAMLDAEERLRELLEKHRTLTTKEPNQRHDSF
jgi:2-polyprenyl-3-methyl-5-hydroxy-6-metoxy-1,4-benzoquinol methylase